MGSPWFTVYRNSSQSRRSAWTSGPIQHQIHCRVHLSKLLHECLPTVHQMNKYGGSQRKCPACGTADETRDHIIRCSATLRLQWRGKLWEAIHKFHNEYRTEPLLINVLRSALEEWLQCDSDITVSPILFPSEEVRDLITQQNVIGWCQLLNGRFAKEWSRLQQQYYHKHRNKAENNRRDGGKWQIQLILSLWDQWADGSVETTQSGRPWSRRSSENASRERVCVPGAAAEV